MPVVGYGSPISLAEAKLVADAAEAEALANHWAMVIAIVDSAGHLALLHKMDGAQYGSIAIAQAKAETALNFKRSSKVFEDAVASGGLGLRLLAAPGICPLEGGVPLLRDGKIVGAIGVSGAQSREDGQVAVAGCARFDQVCGFNQRANEALSSQLARAEKARAVAELVRAERNFHWVGLYDVSETSIAAVAWTGASPPAFPTFPVTKGLNGAAVAQKRAIIVQDVSKDARYLTTFGQTQAEAIFPVLSTEGKVVGTIDVESERVNAFGAEDVAFLTACASLLAPLWSAKAV
jgi:glc operon protein GlcG